MSLSCSVKQDIVFFVSVVLSAAVAFLSVAYVHPYLSHSALPYPFVSMLLLFIAIAYLHELMHFVAARYVVGKTNVRIVFLATYGAMMVDYDEMKWDEWLVVASAPQLYIELPLIALYIALGEPVLYAEALLHFSASIPDIVNIARVLTVFKGCSFRMLKNDSRVIGYAVFKLDGSCIEYRI